MDSDRFDALVRSLTSAATRRSLVGLALSTLFGPLLGRDAVSAKTRRHGHRRNGKDDRRKHNNGHHGRDQNDKKGKDKTHGAGSGEGVGKEDCVPTGKQCPAPKRRTGGKGKNHHRNHRLGCEKCCQGTFLTASDGKNHCACKQDGVACDSSAQCCSGTCAGGVCTGPPKDCSALSDACNDGACCASDGACIKTPKTDQTPCGENRQCIAGVCETSCGVDGLACCAGGICATGLVCTQDDLCVACGDNGEVCCAGSSCASPDLVCNPDSGACVPCGAGGDLCCDGGACGVDLVCNQDNVCVACGDNGEACCDGGACGAGLACDESTETCAACGDAGELCCAGAACDGGLVCGQDNTCGACSEVNPCAGNQVCVEGLCQACDVCANGCAFGSVQAAINATNPQLETIAICPGTYVQNIVVDRDLTLIGAGDGADDTTNTILQGSSSVQAPVVNAPDFGQVVRLERLRITGGNGFFGGGILTAAAEMSVIDCTITDNQASLGGGGVANAFPRMLNMSGCEISFNRAALDTELWGGGGVFNDDGEVTLTNCLITENEAARGGGVFQLEVGSTTLIDCTVSDNFASMEGGGVYEEPPGATVTLTNTTVDDNDPDNCAPAGAVQGCMN